MSIRVLIERRVNEFIKIYPEFKSGEANKEFLLFSTFNLLKNTRMPYEDVLDGIIDRGDDYGIDAIYVFSSGQLVKEDDDLASCISKEDKIRILIVQVSREKGFSETQMLKIANGIKQIFNLEAKLKGNADFKRKTELIRNVWLRCFDLLVGNNIEIEIVYTTLSDNEKIDAKVKGVEKDIIKFLKKQELKKVKIEYDGMPTLYKIITADTYDKELEFKEMTPYAEDYNPKVTGYYGLVKLKNFLNFIINKEGQIEERYFEGNVRDYYGLSKKVNSKIQETISSTDRINFWCFNNGITIICDKSNLRGRKIKMSNFHIVNGCQTGHVIYDCRKVLKNDNTSELMVKVIQTKDEAIASDIIDATNSQTGVSPISLHSNELIQKNIEEHFIKYSKMPLFYERRVNYYKRRNKPSDRVVTMMKQFQVFYSVFEKKSSIARGRPTESFERNYNQVFDMTHDYDAHLFAYLLYFKLSHINREHKRKYSGKNYVMFLVRQYGIFHIVRVAFALLLGTDKKINLKEKKNLFAKNKKKLFSYLNKEDALEKAYKEAIEILKKCIEEYKKKNKTAVLNYSLLKNEDLDRKITNELINKFGKTKCKKRKK